VLSPGDRFEGYIVEDIVGSGGTSTVYRAHEAAAPESVVALKILTDHAAADDRDRLRREFGFAKRLQHPHIVSVFDGGPTWLSMELVAGGQIGTVAAIPDRLAGLAQIADALDHAHAHGIIHCDVKPANILVGKPFYRRGALLSDFGSGCSAGRDVQPRPTHVATSLPYGAPELLTGAPPTAAADEYSLACTVVEMIAGAPPFTAATQVGLIAAHLNDPPPRISRRFDWLPTAFDSVLAKALAKRPQDRYQSCTEMIALVTRLVRD
jgi:serine/threonine-protein kinase